jgi:tRNA 2-thiouridine synthesizing protein E
MLNLQIYASAFSVVLVLNRFVMQLELDQDGHLVDYSIWNEDVAQLLAQSLDLELTAWHFEVLQAVRQFYQQFGHSPATRPLIKYLMKTVNAEINNAVLQERFNTGLVARHLSRLAGIPKPPNCL